MKLNHFKIGPRIAMGFAIVILFLIIDSVTGYISITASKASLDEVTQDRYKKVVTINRIIKRTLDNGRLVRNLALINTPSGIDDTIQAINVNREQSRADLKILTESIHRPAGVKLLADVMEARERLAKTYETLYPLAKTNRAAVADFIMKEFAPANTAYWDRLEALIKFQEELMAESTANAERIGHNSMVTLGVVAITATALSILIALFITRSITGPVTEAARVVGAIAQGDLRENLHPQGRDEIAAMMTGLQEMQVRLRDIAAIINASAEEVSSAAVELAATTGQVSQSVSHQSDAVASMSASVEEMSVSISTISDNAAEARATSDTSNNESTQGGEIILRAIEEIGRIANFVQESSAVIQNLQSKSTEISGIVNVIKEIADQTNLLALNAAIEAARAGEQGRGFAVVADEVRKLAERTAQSTQEISEMITVILDISSDAARGMDNGLALIESGTQLASEAGHSIERIQQSSTHAARIVNDISSSLTEQRSASESVAINIEKIAQMIEENTGAAKETAIAANSLEALATKLIQTVSWFRTNRA